MRAFTFSFVTFKKKQFVNTFFILNDVNTSINKQERRKIRLIRESDAERTKPTSLNITWPRIIGVINTQLPFFFKERNSINTPTGCHKQDKGISN